MSVPDADVCSSVLYHLTFLPFVGATKSFSLNIVTGGYKLQTEYAFWIFMRLKFLKDDYRVITTL